MRSLGYTLIELLVVITIISLLAVVGFVNFKDFAADQVTKKAVGQVQSLLRLAQSNATSSTLCNGEGVTTWSLKFTNTNTIELHCSKQSIPTDHTKSTLILENATLAVTGDTNCSIGFPAVLRYSIGVATLTMTSQDINTTQTCLQSSTFSFTITNTRNNSTQSFKLSKGGAINVQ